MTTLDNQINELQSDVNRVLGEIDDLQDELDNIETNFLDIDDLIEEGNDSCDQIVLVQEEIDEKEERIHFLQSTNDGNLDDITWLRDYYYNILYESTYGLCVSKRDFVYVYEPPTVSEFNTNNSEIVSLDAAISNLYSQKGPLENEYRDNLNSIQDAVIDMLPEGGSTDAVDEKMTLLELRQMDYAQAKYDILTANDAATDAQAALDAMLNALYSQLDDMADIVYMYNHYNFAIQIEGTDEFYPVENWDYTLIPEDHRDHDWTDQGSWDVQLTEIAMVIDSAPALETELNALVYDFNVLKTNTLPTINRITEILGL